MRLIGLVLLCAVLLYGCDKIGCRPEKFFYTFAASKRIDTTLSSQPDPQFQFYNYQLGQGSNQVFTYRNNFRDCPNVADDEGSRLLLFEVPAGVSSFRYQDSAQLKAAKALLVLHCECYPYLPVFLENGWIEGERTGDNRWQVSADLELPGAGGEKLRFRHAFTRE